MSEKHKNAEGMEWLNKPVERPSREARGTETFKIDPRRIKLNPDNIRTIDPNNLDAEDQWLYDNIMKYGVQDEIELMENPTVDEDGIEFMPFDGNRRTAITHLLIAAGKFPFGFVPAKFKKKIGDEEALIKMFNTNSGKMLKETERAKGVQRLIDVFKLSVSDVADRLSYKPAYVNKLYAIAQLPTVVKEMIAKNEISAGNALDVRAKIKGDVALINALTEIKNKKAAATDETTDAPTTENIVPNELNQGATNAGKNKKASTKINAADVSHITGKKTTLGKAEELLTHYPDDAVVSLTDMVEFLKGKISLEEIKEKIEAVIAR